jgi:uncharacterized protein (TIRG00374 family)
VYGLALAVLAVVVEYLVVPRLLGASEHLDLLARVHTGWLVAAVVLEAVALLCYALLTRAMLPGVRPRLSRLARVTLATTAVEHVVPAGMVTGPGLGYHLLTAEGVAPADAAFTLAGSAIGSAAVLNGLLWVGLLASLPVDGVHPVYLVVAVLGLVALSGTALLVHLLTRGEERTVRMVRWLGNRLPRVGADRLEHAVRRVGDSVVHLTRSRRLLAEVAAWAALNWLLDMASLEAFLIAFGRPVDPVDLVVAYGVANVLAVVPVVPAGLGIIEASTVSLLVAFGNPAAVVTFGVLGWRLLNFWLPIPVGAAAYLSLRLSARAGRPGWVRDLGTMATLHRRPPDHVTPPQP